MRSNLPEILAERAANRPDDLLYAFYDRSGRLTDSATHVVFERQTNFLAHHLAHAPGIEAGKPVLLSFTPGLAMIRSFFACAKLGAIPVPVPPVSKAQAVPGLDRLAKVAADSGSDTVLFDGGQDEAVRQILESRKGDEDEGAVAKAGALNWIETGSIAGELDQFAATPREPLFLQYTSGSTSSPRGVVVRHQNIIDNCARPAEQNRAVLSWLPHYHDMGLIGYFLFPLVFGGSAHHFSAMNFLRRPVLWFELISRLGVARTSAPNFAFDYCMREDRIPEEQLEGIDLSSLVDIMNASEPVRSESLAAFRNRFSRYGLSDSALTVAYGLAENTLRATDSGRITLPVNREKLAVGLVEPLRGNRNSSQALPVASCGAPVSGVEIAIVDPETRRPVPADRTGEIWLAGSGKTDGYWRRPELSEAHFNAQIAGQHRPGGYMRTGDIGFIAEGELYICGRIRDMAIIRGRNVFPNDVERAVLGWFPEILPGRVAVFGSSASGTGEDSLSIVVEAERSDELLPLEEIGRRVSQDFQLNVLRVAQVRRGSIPKTSSGKIARYLCRSRLERDAFVVMADHYPPQMEEASVSAEDYLDMLLARAGATADDETVISELGLDSLDLVELATVIETAARAAGMDEETVGGGIHDLRLLQSATIGTIRRLLAALAEGTVTAKELVRYFEGTLEGIEKDESARMRNDRALCAGMAFQSGTRQDGDGATLVTGATGFLGSFLVESLLRLDGKPVIALVRAGNPEHASNRVRAALLRTGTMAADAVEEALRTRLRIVRGDIGAPRLGLSGEMWDALSREASDILHCGADVDYVRPYAGLRDANVLGTAEVVRLCGQGRPKVLNHISTTFVYGWTPHLRKAESECNAGMEGLDFGYPQSKWVSEQIVFDAAGNGLDVRVFRPSLITASQSGCYVRGDIVTRLLGYCIRHGVAPRAMNQLSFLPVEVCANNIVAISRAPCAAGTYSVTTNQLYTIEDVLRTVDDRYGYPIAFVPLEGFVDHVNRNCDPLDDLFPLKPFLNNNLGKFRSIEHLRYENPAYSACCSSLPDMMAEPELDATVGWIVDFMIDNRLVPEPHAAPSRLKVVV